MKCLILIVEILEEQECLHKLKITIPVWLRTLEKRLVVTFNKKEMDEQQKKEKARRNALLKH